MKAADRGFPKTANMENPSWNYNNPLNTIKFLKMNLFARHCCIYIHGRSQEHYEKNYFKRMPQTDFAYMPED